MLATIAHSPMLRLSTPHCCGPPACAKDAHRPLRLRFDPAADATLAVIAILLLDPLAQLRAALGVAPSKLGLTQQPAWLPLTTMLPCAACSCWCCWRWHLPEALLAAGAAAARLGPTAVGVPRVLLPDLDTRSPFIGSWRAPPRRGIVAIGATSGIGLGRRRRRLLCCHCLAPRFTS